MFRRRIGPSSPGTGTRRWTGPKYTATKPLWNTSVPGWQRPWRYRAKHNIILLSLLSSSSVLSLPLFPIDPVPSIRHADPGAYAVHQKGYCDNNTNVLWSPCFNIFILYPTRVWNTLFLNKILKFKQKNRKNEHKMYALNFCFMTNTVSYTISNVIIPVAIVFRMAIKYIFFRTLYYYKWSSRLRIRIWTRVLLPSYYRSLLLFFWKKHFNIKIYLRLNYSFLSL